MKKLILFTLLPFIILNKGYSDDLSNFEKYLNEAEMIFNQPAGFTPVKVKFNPDVRYQYAVKHKEIKLEIRYSIFPLKKSVEEYIESKKYKGPKRVILTDPNQGYEVFTATVVMNIAQTEKARGITKLDPAAVKEEFNADWGKSYYVDSNSEFGKGYKFATIVALHKKDKADAYIIYLFDNGKEISKEMLSAFHSLRFR